MNAPSCRILLSTCSFAVCVCLLVLAAGCSTAGLTLPEDVAEGPEFIDQYIIGVGDSLAVDTYRNADLSVEVSVRPDGKITVPVAGEIMVGGMTPVAVADMIAKSLGEYLRDPIVTVTVVGMGSNEFLSRVRVTGAVNGPLSLPYRPGMTVMDVVLEAGGLTEFARPSKTILYRGQQSIRIRLDRILNRGDLATNMTLRPGDVISVPERIF